MAINFVISFTFAPNTTISSSQVNTNFSDEANVWTGIEAETKTLLKLKMDSDPTASLEVATKQYVDHYASWRRPVLKYNSGTVVNIETGLNGTSGIVLINFPDGTQRTDSAAGRIQCNFAQNYALSGSVQSGIQTGSVVANTWYAVYAVKSQANTTDIVACATTTFPSQANFTTINSLFGSNAWVYLGAVANGDNSGSTTGILKFTQSGNMTLFCNACNTGAQGAGGGTGALMVTTASATSLTWTYGAGTGIASGQIPVNIPLVYVQVEQAASDGTSLAVNDSAGSYGIAKFANVGNTVAATLWSPSASGIKVSGASLAYDILIAGFVDGTLGVGSLPLL